jgi:hypothetical protein
MSLARPLGVARLHTFFRSYFDGSKHDATRRLACGNTKAMPRMERVPPVERGRVQRAGQGAGRGGGLKRLPEMMTRVLDPAARRRGLAGASLLTDWATIVGPALAARCQPVKLGRDHEGRGGTLHLRVSGTAGLELQHAAPQLIERINTHFGYPAVGRLRLIQAPFHRVARPSAPPARALTETEEAEIRAAVADIGDGELKSALAGLGRALASRGGAG